MIDGQLETPSSTIHLLPEHLVDQIKAGEVIERPASLIKEIIENSLDAHSTEIHLHLINNGIDLISLEDNGDGMNFSDLPYAFCRHATSKITRFEDLYDLNSFGFRGEALASIAAIAKVTCTSAKKENSQDGGKIVYHAGAEVSHDRQDNLKKGTSLYIKDLFFNTPARLKFIKSAQSEKNALKRMIDSFILANPHVKFSIKWDDQDKEVYPISNNYSDRAARLFEPRKKEPKAYSFEGEYEGHRVFGFISQNSTRGNAHKKHFLFGNKRIFTDRQIHQTILRATEGLYPMGESGHYCVFLEVPENLIDVNVHPNKTQIKFFKLSLLTALLSSEIKKIEGESQPEMPSFPQFDSGVDQSHQQGIASYAQGESTPERGGYLNNHGSNYQRPTESLNTNSNFTAIPTQGSQFQIFEAITPKLIHKENLLEFLKGSLGNIDHNLDNDFIPLMIVEPLEVQWNQYPQSQLIEFLETHGLLCEFLDERTLVLRGYHQIFNGLQRVSSFIECFINYLLGNDSNIDHYHFSHSWLESLVSTGESSSFALELSEGFIKENFKN